MAGKQLSSRNEKNVHCFKAEQQTIEKATRLKFFCLKIKPKNRLYHFYPFAKDRREKINELQAMIFDEESASDAQKFLAPPKLVILEKKLKLIFYEIQKRGVGVKSFLALSPLQKHVSTRLPLRQGS